MLANTKSWRDSKIVWYPIPAALGIAWIGALHFSHRTREANDGGDQNGVRVEGPFYLRMYASLPLRFISRAWGYFNSIEIPVSLREPLFSLYAYLFGCHLDEMLVEDLKSYVHLSDFFYRKLKPGARTVSNESALVSPADGKILHFGHVENDRVEQVKGVEYSLDALLGKSPFSKITEGNSYQPKPGNNLYSVVIYLAPGDYHRFHSPADWQVKNTRHFAGELFSVSPLMARLMNNLFVLNERVSLLGEWKHGFFSMTAVGATNVGSIIINSCPQMRTNIPLEALGRPLGSFVEERVPEKLQKGTEVGGFMLGSTIVLVFEAPKSFQFSVQEGSKIRYGQPLGNLK
ncbi:phosphatidylserine decarboxylase-domain-containing protein [Gorgonomyces haynaldii]|nr:phosphatidylserine decarboxylase-domain-containing protein [Gorgonomyces haynaldii]